jgi:polyisoprenoid-binding protein YceI
MNAVMKCVLGGGALFAVATMASGAEFTQVQIDKSSMGFSYKQMNVPFDGKFRKFDVRLVFDPVRSEKASAQIDVDLGSIDTGSAEGNDEVGGKLWFNTKAFPVAKFVSTNVKSLGANRFEAVGKLTIKGKTMDAAAPFTFKQEGATGVFDGTFVLKRLEFGIGEGAWADVSAVANEVPVKFHVVADSLPTQKNYFSSWSTST